MNGQEVPFFGRLINGSQAFELLLRHFAKEDNSVSICSGFLRSELLRFLFSNATGCTSGRVLTRWRVEDLHSGASDLNSYLYCRDKGLEFVIDNQFHGKAYIVNTSGLVLGSANATLSGMGLSIFSNSEVCTVVPASTDNIRFIDKLFGTGLKISDELFLEIKSVITALPTVIRAAGEMQWPTHIQDLIAAAGWRVDTLTIDDCLLTSPTNWAAIFDPMSAPHAHDRALFGGSSIDSVLSGTSNLPFKRLKTYRWLGGLLDKGQEAYFGRLSQLLHEALKDDPRPRRVEVKILLSNLIAWVDLFAKDEYTLDRPNYSQRLRRLPH